MSRSTPVVFGQARTSRRHARFGAAGVLAGTIATIALADAGGHHDNDCFVVHPLPGCGERVCSVAVCDLDPHCCEVTWDAFCVAHANLRCTARLGDLNGDDLVDSTDLGSMLARWGMVEGDVSGDLVGDGLDLAIVIANWTDE